MRSTVRLFFDGTSGRLNRTVYPEPHEEDHVLHPHLAEPGEVMVEMPIEQYQTMAHPNLHPKVGLLEEHFAKTRF
jgi:hypothetical protein